MKLIAHRGVSALAPENTVSAFRLALARGVHGIELDVQLSKDGIPIVIHDTSLKRTANIDSLVSTLTARELSNIDNGSWFDSQFSNDRFITLNQTLDLINTNAKVYIEIKGTRETREKLTEEVCDTINKRKVFDWVEIISFSKDVLKHSSKILKMKVPLRHVVFLSLFPFTKLETNADYIDAFNIDFMISPFLIKSIRKTGKSLSVGAMPSVSKKLFDKWDSLGVEALMRNDPTPYLN